MYKSELLGRIKDKLIDLRIIKSETMPKKIKFGILKNITMLLNMREHLQVYLGLYEREIFSIIDSLSDGIATAIDVGAGQGMYTLYFLLKTNAKNIIACEPRGANRAILKKNIFINCGKQDSRLTLISKFVGNPDIEDYCSIDSLVSSIRQPCLIKVDIDGGEISLLKNAKSCMRLSDVRWIIETHSLRLEKECIALLEGEGYKVRIIPNAWWRIIMPEERPAPHNRWLIAVPKR